MAFISIQLNSNRPAQIAVFFDSIESTADKPENIEVLLHIDKGDRAMETQTDLEQTRRRFKLRILKTDIVRDFSTLWKPLNLLFKMTDPDAYFLAVLSDEMLFQTNGWDTIIAAYKDYYPDGIFRLRASQFRYRNYADFWECGYAPDSIAFYTRRWLELQGDWNPCTGPDSFQQCVAFYLYNSDPFAIRQYNRDIPVPNLRFTGEGVSIGLTGRAFYKRLRFNNQAWFILMSHKMQQEAKRRAMRLKSHIIAEAQTVESQAHIVNILSKHRIDIVNYRNKIIARLSYKLSWLRITFTNLSRLPNLLYYQGGGKRGVRYRVFGVVMMIATYMPKGAAIMEWSAERGKHLWNRWQKIQSSK